MATIDYIRIIFILLTSATVIIGAADTVYRVDPLGNYPLFYKL